MKPFIVIVLLILIAVSLYFAFSDDKKVEKRLSELAQNENANEPLKKKSGKKAKAVKANKGNPLIPKTVIRNIESSGINLRAEEFVLIWISIAIIPSLLWNIITENTFQSSVIAFVGAILPTLYLNVMTAQRKKKFANQLADALLLLGNSLRSGFSFEQALITVAENMPEPLSGEFNRVNREIKVGISIDQSLTSLADRMDNKDIELLTSAIVIQRQVGGNLAEIVDTISETIQDRIKLKNHINTLTAQGKLSGLIIGILPVILFVFFSFANPEYMSILYETTYGTILLIVGAIMEIAGFIVIRKIINI